ncbi:30S ribosome-binding factor RbfA [Clostridium vitabionis]|jgi:ribosome-binding factor A|uniref:30S ribosome-binding factor RbfA n=1 Tax=Clostridium vitabionis TaxID=2784388 RepID=UPI00188AAC5F|nr:30S ribosome-binding factor RbfA [Clostridium vitabionis]
MHKNTVKGSRINMEVTRTLSAIVRELKDPRISPMTSIMRAEVTKDLKYCKVYVSVLGSDTERENTLRGLKSASGFIRNELARTVNLRNTPELVFTSDTSIAYGVRMSHLIDDVIAEDERRDEEREKDETEDAEAGVNQEEQEKDGENGV